MPDESYKRLIYEPAKYLVENHIVEVCVGTDGDHQDEFLRGERPKDLIRNSIVTPSLGAAIINGKYVNSLPLYRISQELERNGLTLSRQTMANWMLRFADYFSPLWERMRQKLLSLPVTQADETPLLVIHGDPALGEKPSLSSQSYMWVHRSSEYFKENPIILYEYQTSRHHKHPREFYQDYRGVLLTDGLQQYRLVEKELEELVSARSKSSLWWRPSSRGFTSRRRRTSSRRRARLRTA